MGDAFGSKLPKEPEYWEDLARRIREDASVPLRRYAGGDEDWDEVLARTAPWLVAAAAAAMLILQVALPAPDSRLDSRWLERALAPNDAAGTLLGGPAPPRVDELLVHFPPSELEEETR